MDYVFVLCDFISFFFRLQKKSIASRTNLQSIISASNRTIICSICRLPSELPRGGIRRIPTNYIIVRKIEDSKHFSNHSIVSQIWCTLCDGETTALYHCVPCEINLCSYCKDSHERQRKTSKHEIRSLVELRRMNKGTPRTDNATVLKCPDHSAHEVKLFCVTCLQLICNDCQVIIHKNHKLESISKAFRTHQKILRETNDRTRPLCTYADNSVSRLNDIAKKINKKCDQIQGDINQFMTAYYEAVEVHEKTLTQQISKARETKMQIILEQQMELEKRSSEAEIALNFTQELFEIGGEAEILSFYSTMMKRFEHCQKFQPLLDAKISNNLTFLPEIRAPSTKAQHNIPLYGILTTQIVEPTLCTLDCEGEFFF